MHKAERPKFTPFANVLPPAVTESAADVPEGKELKDEYRQTLILPYGVRQLLKETAHTRDTSIQKIMRQAIDLWLEKQGLPSWAEASKRKPRGQI